MDLNCHILFYNKLKNSDCIHESHFPKLIQNYALKNYPHMLFLE